MRSALLTIVVGVLQCMNAMALCSLGMTDLPPPPGGNPWTPTLVIQGRVYERIGPMAAEDGATPRYNQIYLYDPKVCFANRCCRNQRNT